MPLVAFADDEAGGDVEGGKQRRRAMTDVGMGPALRHARHHRQDRLLAVERLDLALLVDAEHQRAVGRRQVEPDDVAHLVDEQRIARQLERLRAMRLQPEGRPDPADRRVREAGRAGHRADRPVVASPASSAACARSRRPPDRRRSSAAGRAGPRPADLRRDPSGSAAATCRPCARARPVRPRRPCSEMPSAQRRMIRHRSDIDRATRRRRTCRSR